MENSRIYVSNKTDKIIYVDKANSFSILNGSFEKMYKGQVTTSGASANSGVAVNLGIINKNLSGITVVEVMEHTIKQQLMRKE